MEQQTLTTDMDTLLREVCSLLRYHRTVGIDSYPLSPEIGSFLELRRPGKQRRTGPQKAAKESSAPSQEPRNRDMIGEQAHTPLGPITSLADIGAEVAGCEKCSLAGRRVLPVAGEGPEKARLLVVGEWLALPDRQRPPAGCIFGVEEDQMLSRMLEAIRLSRREVFITNIIKCGVERSCQPKAEHVKACYGFLQRQIHALMPQVILAMGRVATRMLLGRPEPLSSLRGRCHTYTGPNNHQVVLIPTYHPAFLLHNPEMKKPAWQDLQLLARQLGISLP